jgi:hypothetical protein
MKSWAFVFGAAGAAAAAVVVVALALRKNDPSRDLQEIPALLEDCHDRIQRIEAELHKLRPGTASLSE